MDPSFANLSPSYLAEDNSAPLLGTCIFFVIIETFFISLMYTSRFLSRDPPAHNWMTALLTIAYCVCLGKLTSAFLMIELGGAGHHLPAVAPSHITRLFKLLTAHQILCPLATSLTKLGILILFYQILAKTSRAYQVVIKATFAFVVCTLLIEVIIPFANCRPFAYNWNRSIPGGSCAIADGIQLWRYLSIPNVVSTIIMVAIPLPAMYNLQVSTSLKTGLYIVFSVAVLGLFAAVMRFAAFLAVRDFNDISFDIIEPECWTLAESGIYLVVGVLPMLRPLVSRIAELGKSERLWKKSVQSRESGSGKVSPIPSVSAEKDSVEMFEKALPPIPAVTVNGSRGVRVEVEDDVRSGTRSEHGRGEPAVSSMV